MKTPSFLELKTLVEYLSDELVDAQLQDVTGSDEGIVLSFYRFEKEPKMAYLVFDPDKPFPFLGLYTDNPWPNLKKSKPVILFLKAHAKNHRFKSCEVFEELGRVVKIQMGEDCKIEFRLIPKQANIIVTSGNKSISWYPVNELAANDLSYTKAEDEEEIRSVHYMFNQWLLRRGKNSKSENKNTVSPFEKWKKSREKDLAKKQKALVSIQDQIQKMKSEEWAKVGEFLKENNLRALPPEWSIYVDFKKTASVNMQNCFAKAKAAKAKLGGAEERLKIIKSEITSISDISEEKFNEYLKRQQKKTTTGQRPVDGKLRKIHIEASSLTAYMGKSAADNMDLLRRSKPHDIWMHLKDYPSSHAIIHRQKTQKISDEDIKKIATWLLNESLSDKQRQLGGKFSVVSVECRHVKPIKGDKLGRVSYHNAREILIAL